MVSPSVIQGFTNNFILSIWLSEGSFKGHPEGIEGHMKGIQKLCRSRMPMTNICSYMSEEIVRPSEVNLGLLVSQSLEEWYQQLPCVEDFKKVVCTLYASTPS